MYAELENQRCDKDPNVKINKRRFRLTFPRRRWGKEGCRFSKRVLLPDFSSRARHLWLLVSHSLSFPKHLVSTLTFLFSLFRELELQMTSLRSLMLQGAAVLALVGTVTTSSTQALACSVEPLMASVCFIATNYCPQGYFPADGRLLPINQYQALNALLGTMYGGDGKTTFALPDLRGRSPVGAAEVSITTGGTPISRILWGTMRGQEVSTLQIANLPPAQGGSGGPAKVMATTNNATTNIPDSTVQLAASNASYGGDSVNTNIYAPVGGTQVPLGGVSGGGSGGGGGVSAPFTNLPPQVALSACIAWQGIWPSRD
jgi:microcystin-dependent protein